MKKIGIADCNSFFASCEKVFNPIAMQRPVIVLSNNDGIVVAMSAEAKALGIKRGTPFFKIRHLVRHSGVMVFSSNYELYGDMSKRVFDILARRVPDIEIYSIDEAFLNYHKVREDLTELNKDIRQEVLRSTGIPVSIGIANTKTLAKIANKFAKKYKKFGGVLDLTDGYNMQRVLSAVDVEDIWGVGRRNSVKLRRNGIRTAWDLSKANEKVIKRMLTVTGLRTMLELKGIPCIEIENEPPPKKSIVSSRSFGEAITALPQLKEAVATFISRAAGKLRKQNSAAKLMYVYAMSNRFDEKAETYYAAEEIVFPIYTDLPQEMIEFGVRAAEKIFSDGVKFKKAGVMLSGIIPYDRHQTSLFESPNRSEMQAAALAMDTINKCYGANSVFFAARGTKPDWAMKRELKSPSYTTRWSDLPEVK